MSKILFKTAVYSTVISKIEVAKSTDKSVWIVKNKKQTDIVRKHTDSDNYWDSWEEAHTYLVKKWQGKVNYLKGQINIANENLDKIKAMKEPT